MSARWLLKSSPSGLTPQPSDDQAEIGQLVHDLNRQITATIVTELATGGISAELAAIIDKRDLLRIRISRLEGTQHV
jgi:hypothetical protein